MGMMSEMMGTRSKEEKQEMILKMMEQISMLEIMPKIMPGCMKRLMGNIPYDEKLSYATHILGILATHGSKGISDEQKANYKAKLLEVMNKEL